MEQSQEVLRVLQVSASEQLNRLPLKSVTSIPLISWEACSAISHENLGVCTSSGSRVLLRSADKCQGYEIWRLLTSAMAVCEARKHVFSSGPLCTT